MRRVSQRLWRTEGRFPKICTNVSRRRRRSNLSPHMFQTHSPLTCAALDGTAARIVRLERLGSGGFLAVLEGLARISLDPTSYPTPPALSPFYTAQVSLAPAAEPLHATHAPLVTRVRGLALSVLNALAGSPTPLVPLFDRKLRLQLARLSASSILSFIDSLFHSLPVSPATSLTHYDKCQILAIASTVDRVEFAIAALTKATAALQAVKHEEDKAQLPGELTKRQREYALMQQLLAIKQELDSIAASSSDRSSPGSRTAKKSLAAPNGDDDEAEGDELAELGKRLQEKSFSPEAKKVASREFKRLQKSPPQGAEYGVIRTSRQGSNRRVFAHRLTNLSRRHLSRNAPLDSLDPG